MQTNRRSFIRSVIAAAPVILPFLLSSNETNKNSRVNSFHSMTTPTSNGSLQKEF